MNFMVNMIQGDLALLSNDGERFINIPLKDLPDDVKVDDVLTIENGMFCYIKPFEEA